MQLLLVNWLTFWRTLLPSFEPFLIADVTANNLSQPRSRLGSLTVVIFWRVPLVWSTDPCYSFFVNYIDLAPIHDVDKSRPLIICKTAVFERPTCSSSSNRYSLLLVKDNKMAYWDMSDFARLVVQQTKCLRTVASVEKRIAIGQRADGRLLNIWTTFSYRGVLLITLHPGLSFLPFLRAWHAYAIRFTYAVQAWVIFRFTANVKLMSHQVSVSPKNAFGSRNVLAFYRIMYEYCAGVILLSLDLTCRIFADACVSKQLGIHLLSVVTVRSFK